MTFAVVGELAFDIVVVDDQGETRTFAGGRPFEHLEIAVGVASFNEAL